jgi:hypothetical protein
MVPYVLIIQVVFFPSMWFSLYRLLVILPVVTSVVFLFFGLSKQTHLVALLVLKMCARGLQLQPPEGSLTFVLLCFIINSLREKSLENAAAYMNYPVMCLNLILFSLFLLAKLQWRKVSHLF